MSKTTKDELLKKLNNPLEIEKFKDCLAQFDAAENNLNRIYQKLSKPGFKEWTESCKMGDLAKLYCDYRKNLQILETIISLRFQYLKPKYQKEQVAAKRETLKKYEDRMSQLRRDLPLFDLIARKQSDLVGLAGNNLVDYFKNNDSICKVRGDIRTLKFQIINGISLRKRTVVVKKLIEQINDALNQYKILADKKYAMMCPASANKSEEKKTYRDLTSEISQYMGPWLNYVENAVDQNPEEKSVSFNLDCQSHSESNLAESGNNIETDVADAQHPTIDDRRDDIEPEITTTDPQIENSHELSRSQESATSSNQVSVNDEGILAVDLPNDSESINNSKRQFPMTQVSVADSITSSTRSSVRRKLQEEAIEKRRLEEELKAKEREIERLRKQRELENEKRELEMEKQKIDEEAEIEEIRNKMKLHDDLKRIELEFSSCGSSRSSVSTPKSFSYVDSREHLDSWLENLSVVNSVDGVVDSDTIDLTTQCNINKPSQSDGAIGASKSVNLAKRVKDDQKLPNTDMRPKNPALGAVRPKERTLPKLQYDPAKDFVPQIDTHQSNESKIQSQIKLPKLELATFSGYPIEWPEWSSLF